MTYIERYWRDATPADAIKEPRMVARFRNDDEKQWQIDTLVGIDRGEERTWIANSWCAMKCQVYDAPDPGEGWRLIDIDSEKPEPTDEYLNGRIGWVLKGNPCDFMRHLTYRRRITPAVTYVPFTWEDRDKVRGRAILLKWESGIVQEVLAHHFTRKTDGEFEVAKVDSVTLLKFGTFIDTGEPVGKKVTQ